VVVAAALLTAACGLGGDGVVSTIALTAHDSGFEPSVVNLDRTGTYVFHYTNRGSRRYGVDVEGNGVDTDGDVVDPGGSGEVEVTLGQAGTYVIHSQDDATDRSHEIRGTIMVKGG
jgi:hypothetical protein